MQQWLDKKRVPFPYRGPNGKTVANWDLIYSQKKKRTFRKLKPGEDFSVRCWVSSCRLTVSFFCLFVFLILMTWLKPEAQTGLECLWWRRGCTVHLTWDVRGNQSNQSNRRPPQPHWGYGREQGAGTILSRRGGGRGGRRGGRSEGVMWLQTNLCRRRKGKRKRLWQNILKALLGDDWLIAPSPICCHRHRQQAGTLHSLIRQYLHCTDCRSTGVLVRFTSRNKTERKCVIVLGGVCLVYSWWTYEQEDEVMSQALFHSPALVPGGGVRNVSEDVSCIKMAVTSRAAAVSHHRPRLLWFHHQISNQGVEAEKCGVFSFFEFRQRNLRSRAGLSISGTLVMIRAPPTLLLRQWI